MFEAALDCGPFHTFDGDGRPARWTGPRRHPPVSHPVARANPANGRKALFVNQDFTSHIEGVSPRESDALLHFLYEHMSQPEFQVRWRWQVGDVAFWDNRWAQHCALADYYPQRRYRRVPECVAPLWHRLSTSGYALTCRSVSRLHKS